MPDGPTVVYDKSAMQLLSREEARWFTHFFRGVITPVFLIESLSNLAKEFPDKRDVDKVVAAMAAKVQDMGSLPNVPHTELIEMNLRGCEVEMRGVPLVGGGQRVQAESGEWGVFIDETPEEKTLRRWQSGEFDEAERAQAAGWRVTSKSFDLQALARSMKPSKQQQADIAGLTLADLKRSVDLFCGDPTAQFRTLNSAFEAFAVDEKTQTGVKRKWVELGRPHISAFAPYAYYSLCLTTTFLAGVSFRLIPERPTSIVDLQYLYYLPFCQVFTSGDKLHRDLAPLFMRPKQQFIWAQDLKKALVEFVAYYGRHEEELRKQGSMSFARYPPLELQTVIHDAYDVLRPRWREEALVPETPITPEENARIMSKIKPMMEAFERGQRDRSRSGIWKQYGSCFYGWKSRTPTCSCSKLSRISRIFSQRWGMPKCLFPAGSST